MMQKFASNLAMSEISHSLTPEPGFCGKTWQWLVLLANVKV